jgi:hypothetical protein
MLFLDRIRECKRIHHFLSMGLILLFCLKSIYEQLYYCLSTKQRFPRQIDFLMHEVKANMIR